MPAINHTHTYVRYTDRFYRCAAPKCTHYIDKNVLVNKMSLCNLCGNEFMLTRNDLRRVKPRCAACSNTKTAKLKKAALTLFDKLGLGVSDES
jgi:hypothetical protein